MNILRKKIVLLSSGGLDSSTVAGLAFQMNAEIYGLSFDYGQRHRKELDAAKFISRHFSFKEFKIIKLDLSLWGGSSLTDSTKELHIDGLRDNIIPNTYVPGRNTIFIAVALSYAEAINADFVGLGVNALDYSGYPDCRPDYIDQYQKLANLASKRGRDKHPIILWTPLLELNKEDILKLAFKNNVPVDKTWSCYAGGVNPCGLCDSCRIRENALKKYLANNS
tara:strand:- start:1021 stop:1689 length:669 start_codon:yes stop_codon:yes gene_type:complete